MFVRRAGEPGDGVDDEQRRMARGVDGLAHGRDVRRHAGRRLVVDDADGLDLVPGILAQARLDHVGLDAAAPAGRVRQVFVGTGIAQHFRRQAQPVGHLLPQRREVAGLEHQHVVAHAHRVRQRRFPRARARSRVDGHRMPRPEDLLDAAQHLQSERAEFRAAVVDGREAHRAQDPVGNRARARNLEEMPAGGMEVESEHVWSFRTGYLHAKRKITREKTLKLHIV